MKVNPCIACKDYFYYGCGNEEICEERRRWEDEFKENVECLEITEQEAG